VLADLDALSPSLWFENVPSIASKRWRWTPIIASRIGNLAELIEDGERPVVEAGDVAQLSARSARRRPSRVDNRRGGGARYCR
jgi:hypothetical protein